jgi:threonine dehydrogenase-like Zn-dependent dehydrogenase
MKALVFERNLARFGAARLASSLAGSGRAAGLSPLRLVDLDPPALPAEGWARVRPLVAGICGSDLSAIDGRSSRYFEDVVSFPFVPGHEVVGTVEAPAAAGAPEPGTRVVVEPVLGCLARGIDPPCEACAAGRSGACQRVAFGHLAPGLQIGFCADTGGGWSAAGLVAHASQLHRVPEQLSDEDAVLVEPTACAVHGALRAGVEPGASVAVLGAGTLGLAFLAALRHLTRPGAVLAGAKHPHQRRLAEEMGADVVVEPERLGRAVRLRSRSLVTSRALSSGADVVADCVGSAESLAQALSMVRPGGRLLLVGMPGVVRLDLAPLWHREVQLVGAYAYGTEETEAGPRRTFELAMEVVAAYRLGRLVSAAYPLQRFEEAIAHAGSAGRRGAVKVVFDLRRRREGTTGRRRSEAGR